MSRFMLWPTQRLVLLCLQLQYLVFWNSYGIVSAQEDASF